MSVAVITPPAALVSLELAKKHLRVDDSDSDDLIALQLAAACAGLDGPGGWLGRAIGEQTLELRQEGFSSDHWRCGSGYAWDGCWSDWTRWPFERVLRLPYPPLISVESITYEDGTGVDQVLTSSGWKATDEGVEPSWGTAWPSGRVDASAVRIRYRAGYETAPAPIQSAVLLNVAALYANREADVIDARAMLAANPAYDALLAPYRVWSV